MSPEIAKLAIQFLRRTTLRGDEMEQFLAVHNALAQVVKDGETPPDEVQAYGKTKPKAPTRKKPGPKPKAKPKAKVENARPDDVPKNAEAANPAVAKAVSAEIPPMPPGGKVPGMGMFPV